MDINFNKNEDHNKLLLSDLKQRFAKVRLGGGEKRIEKLHAEGKMTARERYRLFTRSQSQKYRDRRFCGRWHVYGTRRLPFRRCRGQNRIHQRKAMYCGRK